MIDIEWEVEVLDQVGLHQGGQLMKSDQGGTSNHLVSTGSGVVYGIPKWTKLSNSSKGIVSVHIQINILNDGGWPSSNAWINCQTHRLTVKCTGCCQT